MADYDWGRIAVEGIGGVFSAAAGLIVGVWKLGRNSAVTRQAIRDDYDRKINALRDETRAQMAQAEKEASARMDLLLGQIRETLEGIRRQMDELRYHNEHYFLPKEAFEKFRTEYREDNQRIDEKLDRILKRKASGVKP